jgi:hypothetical protein
MSSRPRLAVVTTVYRTNSHSDVIVSRWLDPLPSDRAFGWPVTESNQPRTEIASLYIAQFPEVDTGRAIAAKHGVPIYETVRDALTLGGDTLAVDGVLLIGEHGDYPYNELFQLMYPRRELFDEIVEVFRESGRSVPVFNDKHLSYDADSAQHMVAVSKEMGFPLMAGSSIPTAGCASPWTMPTKSDLAAGMGLFYGGLEAYGYHSIEFLQSLVARRSGGEAGIESVTVYYGDNLWEAQARGAWPDELMQAALDVACTAQPGPYRDNLKGHNRADFPDYWPAAFCFQHADGLQTTYISLDGHMKDFTVAVEEKNGTIHSGCSGCSSNTDNFFAHFAQLNAVIEEFMLTGKSPYPIEHSLLCTLAINAAVRAFPTPGKTIPTPQLALPYHLNGNDKE